MKPIHARSRARRTTTLRWLVAIAAIAAVGLYWRHWIHEQRALERKAVVERQRASAARRAEWQRRVAQPPPLPGARTLDTAHYRITTTADDAQTRQVADAVEALYPAYLDFARRLPGVRPRAATDRLRLTLYANRAQFQANNFATPWAEAYYRRPVCYAYVAKDAPNPYHWMLHEATHQLNAEVAGLSLAKWANEGLASYFGASRLREGALHPGEIDPDTYPVWALGAADLSGSLDRDVREGRIIPLRTLVSGIDAPPMARNVNRYYIEYWSLVHFLLHGEGGRHAAGFRRAVARGGGLEAFTQEIGPPERIELAWYADLRAKIARYAPDAVEGDDIVAVPPSE